MSEARIYWVRYLNPAGAVRQRLLLLAAGDLLTARLLLERQWRAVVMQLWQAPLWLTAVWLFLRPLLTPAWKAEQLAEFFHSLGVMLRSGLPIDMALAELAKDMQHAGIRRFAERAHASVVAGNPLSLTLEHYEHRIPPAVRALVGVGEHSGTLDRTLIEAGEHLRRLQRIRQDVGRALIYPAFAMLAVLAAVAFWVWYVLPEVARMFRQMGAKLPSYTLAAMDALQVLQELTRSGFWFAAAAAAVAAAVVLRSAAVRYQIFRVLYRLPVSGLLIRASSMAYITEYMALLIGAGLPLTEALKVLTRNVRNPFYGRKLEQVREGVERGHALSVEMDRAGVFPAMVVRMVSVGEQTGTLDRQLNILAADFRQRLQHVIASLGEVLKPLLILVAGLFFILVVVVFLLPVYQLISQVMR